MKVKEYKKIWYRFIGHIQFLITKTQRPTKRENENLIIKGAEEVFFSISSLFLLVLLPLHHRFLFTAYSKKFYL